MSFKISWKVHALCILIGFVIAFVMRSILQEFLFNLFYYDYIINFTGNEIIDVLLLFAIMLVPITLIHELLHAAAYKTFGHKVRIGSIFII